MARDYVKLHTCILDDPDINGLSPMSGWIWTRMLALAGRREDRGRIGEAREVAYVLRVSEADVARAVDDLGGRVTESNGQLHFRDWSDWQAASNRERQAAYRDTRRGCAQRPVTDGNGMAQDVTDDNENTYTRGDQTKPRETKPTEQTGTADAAPPATDNGTDPDRWQPFYDAVSESLGGVSVRKASGAVLAGIGKVAFIAGRFSDDDVGRAVALWRRYAASDEWAFRPRRLDRLADSFGPWAEEWARFDVAVER